MTLLTFLLFKLYFYYFFESFKDEYHVLSSYLASPNTSSKFSHSVFPFKGKWKGKSDRVRIIMPFLGYSKIIQFNI